MENDHDTLDAWEETQLITQMKTQNSAMAVCVCGF